MERRRGKGEARDATQAPLQKGRPDHTSPPAEGAARSHKPPCRRGGQTTEAPLQNPPCRRGGPHTNQLCVCLRVVSGCVCLVFCLLASFFVCMYCTSCLTSCFMSALLESGEIVVFPTVLSAQGGYSDDPVRARRAGRQPMEGCETTMWLCRNAATALYGRGGRVPPEEGSTTEQDSSTIHGRGG